MTALLVGFCDKRGERIIRNEVIEVIPRIGEKVSITNADGQFICARVLDVGHQISKPVKAFAGTVDVRVHVFLDLD